MSKKKRSSAKGIFDDFDFLSNEEQDSEDVNQEIIALQLKEPASDYERGRWNGPINKRNRAIRSLAKTAIECLNLAVLDHRTIMVYMQDVGCYEPLVAPEQEITHALMPDIRDLSPKDLRDIIELIRTDPACQIDSSTCNCDECRVNTYSGVVDWNNGAIYAASSSFHYTYSVNASFLGYEEEVETPCFDRYCQTSLGGNLLKRQLLLEFIGYSLSDTNRAKMAMFLKGAADSGKSIIIGFVTRLLGEEQVSDIAIHDLNDKFQRYMLRGRKLNCCGEIQGKPLSDISTFKKVTGNDRIEAEPKGGTPIFFRPTCKLLFAGNSLPGTTEADATAAFVNRMAVLIFDRSIPKEKQDRDLAEKLWAERDAIFTLALGALKELRERNYIFTVPEDTRAYLDNFSARSNSLMAFVSDECVIESEAKVFNDDLMRAYTCYCRANGYHQLGRNKVYELLDGIPGVLGKRITIGAKSKRGHTGICLKQSVAIR